MKDTIVNYRSEHDEQDFSSSLDAILSGVDHARKIGVTFNFGDVLRLCAATQHQGDDLPELIHVLFESGLCSSHRRHQSLREENALMALAENQPINRQMIHEAAVTLIDRGIDVNCCIEQVNNGRDNALLSLLRNAKSLSDRGCCLYGSLNKSTFFDTLQLLIDSGVQVDHIDKDGFNAVKYVLELINQASREGLCVECSVNDGSGVGYLRRGLLFIDQLLNLGAKPEVPLCPFSMICWCFLVAGASLRKMLPFNWPIRALCQGGESDGQVTPSWAAESAHFYAFDCFNGDEIIAVVGLLCRHGVDLNGRAERTSNDGRAVLVTAIDFSCCPGPLVFKILGRLWILFLLLSSWPRIPAL